MSRQVDVYEFGHFSLDQRTFELRRDGRPLRVERLSHDFLAYLIRHRERVIPTSELLAQLWPGVVVTRGVLARVAHRTREAIDDDASSPLWIATLRGRGYRFVGEVRERESPGSDPRESSRQTESSGVRPGWSDSCARALELLDAGDLAALRKELVTGLDEPLRATAEREAEARPLRNATRISPTRGWRSNRTVAR